MIRRYLLWFCRDDCFGQRAHHLHKTTLNVRTVATVCTVAADEFLLPRVTKYQFRCVALAVMIIVVAVVIVVVDILSVVH